MPIEVELKLALPPRFTRAFLKHPVLAQASAPAVSRRVDNTYFDTPDLALRQRGVALRVRKIGRRFLQTVKCASPAAAGLSTRPEWETPYRGALDFSAIDDKPLRRWLASGRIRRRLEPAFQTAFTRRTWRLEPDAGCVILLMLDQGRVSAGEQSMPLCEIELELQTGTAHDLFAIAQTLAADLPVKPEALSKAQRGYLVATGEHPRPTKAASSPLDRETTRFEAFRLIAQSCLDHLQANEAGVIAGEDPEFVHQMRVALRRLRSALRVFAPILPADRLAGLIPRLRELAGTLGNARDWDVLGSEMLAPVVAAFPGDVRLRRLDERIAANRAAAQRAAVEAIAAPGYGRLLIDLGAFLHDPALKPSDVEQAPLTDFAELRLGELKDRAVKRAKRARSLDVARLHALRIGVKRWRYALEFFAPLLPARRVRRCLRRMTALQEDLGTVNDFANAGRLLPSCCDQDAALHEASAFVSGWHGPRYGAVLRKLPADIERLL